MDAATSVAYNLRNTSRSTLPAQFLDNSAGGHLAYLQSC
jgi:hypothetical protein